MMTVWVELLPLFLVRLLADKHCERICQNRRVVVNPRPGVMIEVEERPVAQLEMC